MRPKKNGYFRCSVLIRLQFPLLYYQNFMSWQQAATLGLLCGIQSPSLRNPGLGGVLVEVRGGSAEASHLLVAAVWVSSARLTWSSQRDVPWRAASLRMWQSASQRQLLRLRDWAPFQPAHQDGGAISSTSLSPFPHLMKRLDLELIFGC